MCPTDDEHNRSAHRRRRDADGSGAMFDRIAGRYDRLNRILSLGLDRRWRRRLVRALACGEGARVLDLATGTADVALAIIDAHPTLRP